MVCVSAHTFVGDWMNGVILDIFGQLCGLLREFSYRTDFQGDLLGHVWTDSNPNSVLCALNEMVQSARASKN